MNKNKLTSKNYWETYYKKNHANKTHIINVCSHYDYFWDLFLESESEGKKLIEIGGFPGRYLAYLADRFKIEATCLDYNSDIGQIKDSFQVMDVTDFEIIQDDFTTFKTQETYDFVLSNGFIEHFKDFDTILDLHVNYMKKGSKLMVMIPNMRGYIKVYKYLVDYKNLKMHNLKSMRLKVFDDFSKRNQLKTIYLGYSGGFPYGVHQNLNVIQKTIYKFHWIFFKKIGNAFLQKKPNSNFSSTIIAIYIKE